MATLYITEQGATLRKVHNRLLVERDETTLAEIHDFKVERVILFGNVQISTAAVSFLLERGIDTVFLNYNGKLKGRLAPLASKNIHLRAKQFERVADPSFVLTVAQAFVTGKMANCGAVLARQQRNHTAINLATELSQLKTLRQRTTAITSLESLRGLEGQAAALYFPAFGRLLRQPLNFQHRNRRPPLDPVNALLSLGYTLLYQEAISALAASGFEPYLGFLHALHYGRCSLALDLMEEFRPLVADRLALNLVNLEILKAGDFSHSAETGVRLSDKARKRFFQEYERLVTAEFAHRHTGERVTLRRAWHEQAGVLRRTIVHGTPYQPFNGWH